MFVYVVCNPACLPVPKLCVTASLSSSLHACVSVLLLFLLCVCVCVQYDCVSYCMMSEVALWSDVVLSESFVLYFLIHTGVSIHASTAVRGWEPWCSWLAESLINMLCSGFPTRCGYKTNSRLLSFFSSPLPSLPPRLFVFLQRDTGRKRTNRDVCF